VVHGAFKSPVRVDTKTMEEYSDVGHVRPQSRHVKDFLRLTLIVDGHERMGDAVAALHEDVVSLKSRLDQPTHDVIAVVRFQSVLAEVQLTFKPAGAQQI
jgi:hypothetical protein